MSRRVVRAYLDDEKNKESISHWVKAFREEEDSTGDLLVVELARAVDLIEYRLPRPCRIVLKLPVGRGHQILVSFLPGDPGGSPSPGQSLSSVF